MVQNQHGRSFPLAALACSEHHSLIAHFFIPLHIAHPKTHQLVQNHFNTTNDRSPAISPERFRYRYHVQQNRLRYSQACRRTKFPPSAYLAPSPRNLNGSSSQQGSITQHVVCSELSPFRNPAGSACHGHRRCFSAQGSVHVKMEVLGGNGNGLLVSSLYRLCRTFAETQQNASLFCRFLPCLPLSLSLSCWTSPAF